MATGKKNVYIMWSLEGWTGAISNIIISPFFHPNLFHLHFKFMAKGGKNVAKHKQKKKTKTV